MLVSIDCSDGRVMVLADNKGLPVPMVRKDGAWRVGVFSADELKYLFVRASDKVAETLLQEAMVTFSSNPKRFRFEFLAL